MSHLKLIVILILLIWKINGHRVDRTIEPNIKGEDVVEASIRKIHNSGIFEDDNDFLRHLAYVESKFGHDDKTYRGYYHGGIWQVDNDAFLRTRFDQGRRRSPKLASLHEKIEKIFGIKWLEISWMELRKPLFSGLAARMILDLTEEVIPEDIEEQARFWKRHFEGPQGSGTEDKSKMDIDELFNKDRDVEADMVMVLDGSGSIGRTNFERAKQTVANVARAFPKKTANVGVTVYSSAVYRIVPLYNNVTMAEIERTILNTNYPDEGTQTSLGMMDGIQQFQNRTWRPLVKSEGFCPDEVKEQHQLGVPRIMMVLTDGNSNAGFEPDQAASKAASLNITVISVGIGSGIRDSELLTIAQGVLENRIRTASYQTLVAKVGDLIQRSSRVPQRPEIHQQFCDVVKKRRKRQFEYDMKAGERMTLDLTVDSGAAVGYYSFLGPPSSAMYDGELRPGLNVITAPQKLRKPRWAHRRVKRSVEPTTPISNSLTEANDTIKCYIAIEGLDDSNQYRLEMLPGDQSPAIWPILVVLVVVLAIFAAVGFKVAKNF